MVILIPNRAIRHAVGVDHVAWNGNALVHKYV